MMMRRAGIIRQLLFGFLKTSRSVVVRGVVKAEGVCSVELYTTRRNALCASQPASEELHDGHHLVPVAWHTIAVLLPILDLDKIESIPQLRDSTVCDR